MDEVVIYSGSWEVRGLAPNGSGDVLPPIAALAAATALDYAAAGEWLYWADGEAGAVWRCRRDGSGRALVAQAGSDVPPGPGAAADGLAGLAVDWAAGNLYWADPRRALLEVARLDGSHRYVLLDTEPLAATSLCVDPAAGWLFLSGGGWIQRARLDGSARDLLYNGTAVADIALDPAEGRLYWADAWEAAVWRMRYDGSAHERLAAPPAALMHPVALALLGQTLFWLDT